MPASSPLLGRLVSSDLSTNSKILRSHSRCSLMSKAKQIEIPVIQLLQLLKNIFPAFVFVMRYKVVQAFESVDGILKCDRWNLYKVVLTLCFSSWMKIIKCYHSEEIKAFKLYRYFLGGTVYYAIQGSFRKSFSVTIQRKLFFARKDLIIFTWPF